MGFGAALLALSAVQSISQIKAGYEQKAEADLNATILAGEAGLVDVKKGIEAKQYDRAAGQAMSTGMARTAAAGLRPTGSAMAVMLDSQKQIQIDKAIGQFNLEQEKRYITNQASAYRRAGSAAVRSGYSNAFSTILSGAANYGMYKGGGKLTQQGTVKDTTFDSVVKKQWGNR